MRPTSGRVACVAFLTVSPALGPFGAVAAGHQVHRGVSTRHQPLAVRPAHVLAATDIGKSSWWQTQAEKTGILQGLNQSVFQVETNGLSSSFSVKLQNMGANVAVKCLFQRVW